MRGLLFLFLYIFITGFFAFGYVHLAKTFGWLDQNYRGKEIPVGLGAILPIALLVIVPFALADKKEWEFLCPLLLLGMIGWVDDRFGERKVKGIKGHLHLLWREKRISSGLWKAITALGVGLFFYMQSREKGRGVTGILPFIGYLGTVHLMNLLDLRPLRAIKGFFFLLLPPLLLSAHIPRLLPTLLFGVLILAYFDRNERAMMGDAGSNLLGGVVGYMLFQTENEALWATYAVLSLLLALYAENASFSHFIESHPFLQKLDRLGRPIYSKME